MTNPPRKAGPVSPVARLRIYQAERFPLARYVPLIATFVFSSAAYSRLVRGAPGFIPAALFAAGCMTALGFFFLLRVLDEHKDAESDRRHRPELPVPRGLVTLAELRAIAGGALLAALSLNALLAPALLLPCLAIAVWAALMTAEFFVPRWLRSHPTAYLISHMAIMPMIDTYTTGLDWLAAGVPPPAGLAWFLVVTFLNGTLIEIGRKTRAPDAEREGVDTYTKAWGRRGAPAVWLAVLLASALSAWLAARAAGSGLLAAVVLAGLFFAAARPAVRFLRTPSPAAAAGIENASGLWVLTCYLLLGGGPWVARRLGM